MIDLDHQPLTPNEMQNFHIRFCRVEGSIRIRPVLWEDESWSPEAMSYYSVRDGSQKSPAFNAHLSPVNFGVPDVLFETPRSQMFRGDDVTTWARMVVPCIDHADGVLKLLHVPFRSVGYALFEHVAEEMSQLPRVEGSLDTGCDVRIIKEGVGIQTRFLMDVVAPVTLVLTPEEAERLEYIQSDNFDVYDALGPKVAFSLPEYLKACSLRKLEISPEVLTQLEELDAKA